MDAVLAGTASLKIVVPLVRRLRAELRAGRKWQDELRRITADKAVPAQADVADLVASADAIWMDLREPLGRLHRATTLYCVCRAPPAPPMVECSACKEVFHYE